VLDVVGQIVVGFVCAWHNEKKTLARSITNLDATACQRVHTFIPLKTNVLRFTDHN
jgi:hypothetical protein